MDTTKQCLLHDPEVCAHVHLIDPKNWQRSDHSRSPVPTPGRAAVHEALHESSQRTEVQRAVLHLVIDVIVLGAGRLLALLVTATASRVIDGLASFEEFDRAIDPAGLLVGIGGSGRRASCDQGRREKLLASHSGTIAI